MIDYLNLLRRVRETGKIHQNRTGIPTRRLTGAMLEFNLADGFPAMTTKKLAFGAVKGELICFINAYNSAAQFRHAGCGIWDANANENKMWLDSIHRRGEDDLGRVYGQQWRKWYGGKGNWGSIDQLANAMTEIRDNPQSRRIIVTAWQPAELDQMALPPCHLLYQYHVDVEAGELSLTMYQRSCDMFLGVPFNIASYALLLELSARATGLKAGKLVMFLADVHIYENHLAQVDEQLAREPYRMPQLRVDDSQFAHLSGIKYLEAVEPGDITLLGYRHHEAIKAEMAV